jgi:alginate O-acetyltransferase complex protein AlgI
VIFHSLDFLIFVVLLVSLYWALPHRWQNLLLLAGSYVFYGWVHPWFLTLIFTTTFNDYWSARGM